MTRGELTAGSKALRTLLDGHSFMGRSIVSWLGNDANALLDQAAATVIDAYTKQHAINVSAQADAAKKAAADVSTNHDDKKADK